MITITRKLGPFPNQCPRLGDSELRSRKVTFSLRGGRSWRATWAQGILDRKAWKNKAQILGQSVIRTAPRFLMTGKISPLEVVNNWKLPQVLNVMIALRKVIWSKIAKPSFHMSTVIFRKERRFTRSFSFVLFALLCWNRRTLTTWTFLICSVYHLDRNGRNS